MPRIHKKTSKRVPLSRKYKIEKKVREHKRKARRDSKGKPKRIRKDPGIPNLWPYKEQLLEKMEKAREKDEQNKKRVKDGRDQLAMQMRMQSMEELAQQAEAREQEYLERLNLIEKTRGVDFSRMGDNAKKTYYREFKKVVEAADVLLEVVDARDPLGCRCRAVEEAILANSQKRVVLILNKIDLVPKEVVQAWLTYLRHELPTVAFKCSTTQKRGAHLKQSSVSAEDATNELLQSNECLGADTVIQLLKNYARSHQIKTSLSVGVIGYPNVGKSSLINSLKRSRAAHVGATPGVTKVLEEIRLDKNIKLLDCPGIVFATSQDDVVDITLRNCIKPEKIADPVPIVEAILEKTKKTFLLDLYKIPSYQDINHFLAFVARRKGRILPGDVPDHEQAARAVIYDWNSGKIPYYTRPPQRRKEDISSTVVEKFGEEFDAMTVFGKEESAVIDSLPDREGDNFIEFEATLGGADDVSFMEALEGLAVTERVVDDSVRPEHFEMLTEKKEKIHEAVVHNMSDEEDALNPRTNRDKRKKMKQQRRKKSQKDEESDDEEQMDRAYNFAEDFEVSDEESEDDASDDDEELLDV